MTEDEIINKLARSGIHIFNTVSDKGTALPYGVVFFTYPNNTAADNRTYCLGMAGRLEVYTLDKDYETMAKIETAFYEGGIPFSHDSDYLNDQKCYMEIYSFGSIPGKIQLVPLPPEEAPEEEEAEDPEEV